MIVILMSGAKGLSDLIRDWSTWTDLHRVKPDVIMLDHTVAQELAMETDPKRLQLIDGDGDDPRVVFMGVQVHCFCTLRDSDPGAFDCPSEFDDPDPAAGVTGEYIDEPPPAKVAKKAAKPIKKAAKVTKPVTRKR